MSFSSIYEYADKRTIDLLFLSFSFIFYEKIWTFRFCTVEDERKVRMIHTQKNLSVYELFFRSLFFSCLINDLMCVPSYYWKKGTKENKIDLRVCVCVYVGETLLSNNTKHMWNKKVPNSGKKLEYWRRYDV